MRIVADTHTHTLMSGEAFCTLNENIAAAKKAGLTFLAVTDHACAMEGAATRYYFRNLPQLPQETDGVKLLRVLPSGSQSDHDRGWLAIAENPLVDVIGHCGNPSYPFTHETVIRSFATHGKIVEINNHSFGGRPGSAENCRHIAQLCMAYGVPVVVSSDAHHSSDIGKFDEAVSMLQSIGFPEELILNADCERFEQSIAEKGTRK